MFVVFRDINVVQIISKAWNIRLSICTEDEKNPKYARRNEM